MKAILAFKLPEESEDFKLHTKALSLFCVIHDFQMYLRSKYKYEDVETIKVEEVREKLVELLQEHDCDELF